MGLHLVLISIGLVSLSGGALSQDGATIYEVKYKYEKALLQFKGDMSSRNLLSSS